MEGQASSNDGGRGKESIADQWIDFLLKQARAAGEDADLAQPPSAASLCTSTASLQEIPQPGDFSELPGNSMSAMPKLVSQLTVHICLEEAAPYGIIHLIIYHRTLSSDQAWARDVA